MATFTQPLDQMAAGRTWVRNKWVYYISSVTGLMPRPIKALGTLGVSETGVLLYDPEEILRWSVKQLGTVFVHEALHLLRHHPARARRLLGLPETQPLRPNMLDENTIRLLQIWNLAADCEINDDLLEAGGEFPGEVCLPERFGFPNGLTAEEYYRLLIQQGQNKQKQGASGRAGSGKGQGKRQKGKGRTGQSGEPQGQKDTDQKDQDQESEEPGAGTGPGNGRCGSCAGLALPEEEQFQGVGRTQAELRNIERQVVEAVQRAVASRGDVPGGWARWADAAFTPPKIPWQQKLARVVRGVMAHRMGAVDHSHTRISRRQAGIGFGVGRPILPALVAPQARVAVVIDTSGSMGKEELEAALIETRGVLLAVGGTVDLCACDAKVHELKPVRDVKQAVGLIKGGGGTDFRPAFDALMDQPKNKRPDVVVFLTDGMGPAPESPPPCRVIWGLIGEYKQRPCEWGEVVEIE